MNQPKDRLARYIEKKKEYLKLCNEFGILFANKIDNDRRKHLEAELIELDKDMSAIAKGFIESFIFDKN